MKFKSFRTSCVCICCFISNSTLSASFSFLLKLLWCWIAMILFTSATYSQSGLVSKSTSCRPGRGTPWCWQVQEWVSRWFCLYVIEFVFNYIICCIWSLLSVLDTVGRGFGWAEGSTSSVMFARWGEYARRHSAVSCAKMAEPIDLSFVFWTRVGRRKHKFNHIRQVALMCQHGMALCRHIANTMELSVCGSNVALCQITLTTCYYWEGLHENQSIHAK